MDFLAKAMSVRPKAPLGEPLCVALEFRFSRPKSHYGTGKNAAILKDPTKIWHTTTPDADNLVKMVCDALNGVFWKDDSFIVQLYALKTYVPDSPGVHIRVAKADVLWQPCPNGENKPLQCL